MVGTLLHRLSPFQHKKDILVHNQSVGDIMSGILQTHDRYAPEYDKICKYFAGGTSKDIGSKIWHFLRSNVDYVIEKEDNQLLKSPSAILATGKTTGSDCKNLSLFTGGILSALNRKGYKINWCYRFSSYQLLNKLPQHIFVVINPGTADEIWIDAVLPKFNWHKQYYYKIDKKVKDMALVALSGMDDINTIGKAKKGKEKVKTFFKKVGKDIEKTGKVTLKIGASPARNSFLALVKLNFRGLANKLRQAITKDEAAVRRFWQDIGGDYTALKKSIEVGERKKMLGAIGDPVTASAATASPILIKIYALFKKLGISDKKAKKILDAGKTAIKKIAKIKVAAIKAGEKGIVTAEGEQIVKDTTAASGGSKSIQYSQNSGGAGSESEEATKETETGAGGEDRKILGMDKKTALIAAGAAAVGLYFITKKK